MCIISVCEGEGTTTPQQLQIGTHNGPSNAPYDILKLIHRQQAKQLLSKRLLRHGGNKVGIVTITSLLRGHDVDV